MMCYREVIIGPAQCRRQKAVLDTNGLVNILMN